ncbi:helix-turn-helix domain-containing protein [Achromobacter sp. UBA2119]|uniref:helix-turn-helix domain-containing protein n=1 Tax=Achromobacter sp. UBA2119 TaxID=1945911 RepID=UPI00257CBACE|nr:helix-turn-helix transcriptional regulator [Achromobacter sp. UBA2119]
MNDATTHMTPTPVPPGTVAGVQGPATESAASADCDYLATVIWHIRIQMQAGAVSIDSTAKAMGTSVRTLQRVLRRDSGVSFRELSSTARLRRAQDLLRESTVSITQIAMDSGYSTPANFSRAFRKASGVAPHEYRQDAMASSVAP